MGLDCQSFRFFHANRKNIEPLLKFPSAEGHSGGSGILIRRRCLAMQSHAIEATWGEATGTKIPFFGHAATLPGRYLSPILIE
jgi:hypothetical protein